MKIVKKYFLVAVNTIILSIFASQCFAQSQSATADKNKDREYLKIINQLYYFIQQNYVEDVDPQILYEGALRGMLQALDDPYSVYMDKSEWRNISDTTQGSFGGVGLSITKPSTTTKDKPAYVEVVQPIDDTPGARAGIQPGDFIIAINGVDTSTITMDEVLGMLRGTIGESVTVTIRRKTVEFDRVLVRALIENPTVKFGMINNIGYIRISEFSTNTAGHVQEAIDSFKGEKKLAGIIVDLRNNGGGLLSSAVEIADKFIDSGIIVQTKSRIAYENAVYHANAKKTVVKDIPVVVLINRATASASEILSGALKDTRTAYLVGEKSFGKGSVQVPSGLVNKDGFKITVARYYSPLDVNIDKRGIRPDLEVLYPEFSEDQRKEWERIEKDNVIPTYVEAHPDMTEAQIASYAKQLKKTYNMEESFIRKIIRNEVYRTKTALLYDLDYDIQLNAAIKVIKDGKFATLMKDTKTLKDQLAEDEAAKKEE
ncbi:MAG: S41 family peptidase [Spirochaetales bacterium]|nr:S41 family peptidase [Spirochaetales bacterium]